MGRQSHEGAAALASSGAAAAAGAAPPPPTPTPQQQPPLGTEPPLAAAAVYKGTTLPHVVVRRSALLLPGALLTHQPERPAASGKVWRLHRRCTMEPAAAGMVRAHQRHLRKAGPLRAVASYARDKNVLKLVREA